VRRNYLLAGAGIASFVFFTLASIPAGVLTGLLEKNTSAGMHPGGIEGTVWHGRINSLDIGGWRLRNTSWNVNPAALLLGRISANIGTRFSGSELTADASISVTGSVSVRDLDAAGQIAPIAARFNLPVTGGHYRIQVTALDISDAWPTSLLGSLHVTGVPITVGGGATGPTGSYTVVFDDESVPENGQLLGTLSDDDGPVEVGGNIVLMPPKNYAIRAKLKARPDAPVEITQVLKFAGPLDSNGRHDFSMAGSL